jgi:hypothetical protein
MHSRGVNSGQRLRFHFFIYKNLISFASWIGVFCTIVDDESEILLGGSGSVDLSPPQFNAFLSTFGRPCRPTTANGQGLS